MLLEANISKTAGDTGFVPKDHHLFVTQCVFHASFRIEKIT